MNYKYAIAFLLFAFLSCGCTSRTAVLSALNDAYVGENADSFFVRHEPPESSYTLNSGGRIYRWSSEPLAFNMPQTTTHQGQIYNNGSFSGHSTTTGGGAIHVYTILQIETDYRDTVVNIAIVKDTLGVWKASRFRELFEEYFQQQQDDDSG